MFENRSELGEEFKALNFEGAVNLIDNVVGRLDGLTEDQKYYILDVIQYIATGRNLVLEFDETWK